MPDVIKDYREFKKIADIENIEFNTIWKHCDAIFSNQFIETLDTYGCSRWEKILNINYGDNDDIDTRRFRIKAKINETLPYTIKKLKHMLEILCGENGFTLNLYNNEYRLSVSIQLNVKNKFNEVKNLLKRVVPANIVIELDIKYNSNETIKKYKHIELKKYTHKDIRELYEIQEVL